MKRFKISIFTPTFNRAYILPKLKESLLRQDCFDFEWLIVDDGSTDETKDLVGSWCNEPLPFTINYYRTTNEGKPRAINKACCLAQSEWLFIIDSDDYLVDNVIGYILDKIAEVKDDDSFVGIGLLRGHHEDTPLSNVSFDNYVDATNLERPAYGLDFDCNEAYKVSVLRKYPFIVWSGELFTPEEVVLNEMSLHGYKLRWYNKVGVISEYLEDGLTKGSDRLVKNNPMGYAMCYNHKLKYTKGLKKRFYYVCQFISQCFLGGNPSYIRKCNAIALTLIALPLGFAIFLRRKIQYRNL